MKLAGQTAAVILTEDGKAIFELAKIHLPDTHLTTISIEESEDLGLWIRLPREGQMHLFLLRWEFILGIDLPSGLAKVAGLKG